MCLIQCQVIGCVFLAGKLFSGIGPLQILQEQRHRGAVSHQMMYIKEQIAAVVFTIELYAQQASVQQAERPHQPVFVHIRQDGDFESFIVHPSLAYLTVLIHEESHLQIRMGIHHLLKGFLDAGDIHVVAQSEEVGYVVDRGAVVGHAVYEDSLLGCSHGIYFLLLMSLYLACSKKETLQHLHRGVFLQIRAPDRYIKGLGQEDIQPDGRDGGESRTGDISRDPEFPVPYRLCHTVEYLLLGLVLRRYDVLRLVYRLRQSPSVHLAVLVERYGLDRLYDLRHHVGRLLCEDVLSDGLCIRFTAILRHHIGRDIFTSSGVVKGCHSHVLYEAGLSDHALHLGELYAESSYLYLSVTTAYELYIAVREETHHIARTISGIILTVGAHEGVVHEHLCRLVRTVQIARCHMRSRDQKLAGRSRRQTVALTVRHIELDIVQRLSYGVVRILLIQLEHGGINGAFRRAVTVVESIVFRRLHRRKSLAACGEML